MRFFSLLEDILKHTVNTTYYRERKREGVCAVHTCFNFEELKLESLLSNFDKRVRKFREDRVKIYRARKLLSRMGPMFEFKRIVETINLLAELEVPSRRW